jgi:hypothetical protein
VEVNNTGGQGSRRAVAPDDDDEYCVTSRRCGCCMLEAVVGILMRWDQLFEDVQQLCLKETVCL